MTTRRNGWLGAISALTLASCGGQFTTVSATGSDAGVGGSTTAGGATGTGGRTSTGGRTGAGGVNPGTGGSSRGGSIGAGGTMSSGPSEVGFRAELARTYCTAFVSCCSAGGIVFDETQCQASFQTLLGNNLSSPRTGYYTYDAAEGARCLNSVQTTLGPSCGSLPSNITCDGVFQGTLKPGDACASAVECARGPGDSPSCDPGPDGISVCILKRRASEGEACVQNCVETAGATTCGAASTTTPDRGRCYDNDGLYCSDGVCARQVAIGSLCDDNPACDSDGTCDLSVGICVPLADAGKPCSGTSACREELHCSAGYCVPDLAPGEPCSTSSECSTGTCRAGTCSPLEFGISILCAALGGAVPVPVPTP